MEIEIEPTARHDADLGFIPVVVIDACGPGNEEVAQRCASSRMVSRIALRGASRSATVSIPVVAGDCSVYGRVSPKIVESVLSCSIEHICDFVRVEKNRSPAVIARCGIRRRAACRSGGQGNNA